MPVSPAFRLATAILAVCATFAFWWWLGLPQPMPGVPVQKLDCTSYTPFGPGESPNNPRLFVKPERIEADIALLSRHFGCVRIYATDMGQDYAVVAAARHGMKVLVGVWVGSEPEKAASQIRTAERLAADYPHVVRAIVVGNETLLRGEMPARHLATIVREVRSKVTVPVTYADVWELWLGNRELAAEVDFVTVHMLPYWEDNPVSAAHGIEHVRAALAKVRAAFPDKEIMIGEVGWPSEGRTRGPAVAGRLEQAAFLRAVVDFATREKLDYNLIEAFDQPWKRQSEGTVGGFWGMYSADRQAKFSWDGPVSTYPSWLFQAVGAALLGLLPPLWLALLARRRSTHGAWLAVVFAAQAAGTVLVLQGAFVANVAITVVHWSIGLGAVGASALAAWLFTTGIGGRARDWPPPAPIAEVAIWLTGHAPSADTRAMVFGCLQALALFGAAVVSLSLLFDPRYRDFPTLVFLIPAAGAVTSLVRHRHRADAVAPEEMWLAGLTLAGAVAGAIMEGPINHQALAWAATAACVAAPILVRPLLPSTRHEET